MAMRKLDWEKVIIVQKMESAIHPDKSLSSREEISRDLSGG